MMVKEKSYRASPKLAQEERREERWRLSFPGVEWQVPLPSLYL
jgi:hypothetical protein